MSFSRLPPSGRVSRKTIFIADGNNRAAVTAAAAFLKVNVYRLEFDDAGAFSFLMGRYDAHKVRFQRLDAWLRQHAIPR
jgi:prophage maintenance system killer protein